MKRLQSMGKYKKKKAEVIGIEQVGLLGDHSPQALLDILSVEERAHHQLQRRLSLSWWLPRLNLNLCLVLKHDYIIMVFM